MSSLLVQVEMLPWNVAIFDFGLGKLVSAGTHVEGARRRSRKETFVWLSSDVLRSPVMPTKSGGIPILV